DRKNPVEVDAHAAGPGDHGHVTPLAQAKASQDLQPASVPGVVDDEKLQLGRPAAATRRGGNIHFAPLRPEVEDSGDAEASPLHPHLERCLVKVGESRRWQADVVSDARAVEDE